MSYQQKDNTGQLFKNRKREKDTHPNATGEALIGGVKYRVSAWTKTDKNGNPWQSLSFTPADQQFDRHAFDRSEPQTQARSLADELDDSVPF